MIGVGGSIDFVLGWCWYTLHPRGVQTVSTGTASEGMYLSSMKLLDRKSLQPFFDMYFTTIKNMKGYVNQETHKAGNNITASSYLDSSVSSLKGLIKCIFFDSRCEYQAQQQRNSRQAKLQTWVTTAFDEEATATVAMDIDNVNLNSVDMKTLIDTRAQIKINQISKKFDNKIKQMENQL